LDDPIVVCKYIGEILPKAQFQQLHAQVLFGTISQFGPRGRERLALKLRSEGKNFDLCSAANLSIPSLEEVQTLLFARTFPSCFGLYEISLIYFCLADPISIEIFKPDVGA
jgi:hypothetical protein